MRKKGESPVKSKVIIAIMLLVLYLCFTYIYKDFIYPQYGYYGFAYHRLSLLEHLIIILFLLLPLIFLSVNTTRPSSYAVWSLYLFSYVSTCFVMFYIEQVTFLQKILLMSLLFLALFLVHLSRFHKFSLDFSKKIDWKGLDKLFIIYILGFVLILILYLINFKLGLPSWEKIYTIRLAAREIKKIPLQGYVIALATSILTIIGVFMFIYKKSIFYLCVTILINLAIFNFQATKTSIAKPLFFLLFAFLIKRYNRITWFITLFLIIFFVALVEPTFFHTAFLSEVFVRRVFAVPGLLNFYHFDFFSHNPKVYLTDSIINFFMKPVYSIPYTFLIGLEYFNNPARNADTGIWMAGFDHFGYIGVIITSLMAGFLLGLLDNILSRNFYHLACIISVYIGTVWTEQAFHTSFLTGGIFYILLFIIFMIKSYHLSKEFSTQPQFWRSAHDSHY